MESKCMVQATDNREQGQMTVVGGRKLKVSDQPLASEVAGRIEDETSLKPEKMKDVVGAVCNRD